MLFHEGPGKPHFVMGYFDTKAEADEAWAGLRKAFKKLPQAYDETVMADKDWKEAYKEHLKPWDHGRLHWVPAWMRGKHAVPADAAVIGSTPDWPSGPATIRRPACARSA
jgi:ribosomal protein L11 methylase PrmA